VQQLQQFPADLFLRGIRLLIPFDDVDGEPARVFDDEAKVVLAASGSNDAASAPRYSFICGSRRSSI